MQIKKKEHKKLFGPYPNAYAARRIVNLLNRMYPLKKCDGNPKKVCLYYHIGECLGYCEKNVDQVKLKEMETEILKFLGGDDSVLRNRIIDKMNQYSENLNFELALELKKELQYIDIVLSKQNISINDLTNRDIIGYYFNNGYISVQILFIRNGKIVGGHTDLFPVISDLQEEMEKTQKKSQEMDEKLLKAVEKLDKKIDEMSDKISKESKHTSALMAQSLVAVGNHLISGNDIKKIEAANKDLLTYLIEK